MLLTPLEGDCCVFCSYGTVPCPPIQEEKSSEKTSCCYQHESK
ncbi:GDCCVxC domain-containing (seleno)protein [Proteus terrae]